MVNRLTQIYTRTGDEGKTGLGDGTRVAKFSTRIECLGSVDELNSIIGLILTENVSQKNILKKIQHDYLILEVSYLSQTIKKLI